MSNNILVLINDISGLYSFRKEVIKAIIGAGYEVFISEPDDDEFVKYFEENGCHIIKTVFNRRGMNPIADFRLMLKYVKIIKTVKPRVVLTYTIKPNVYGGLACRITRTPQIANVTGLGDAIENGGWLKTLTVFLYRLGLGGKSKRVFFQNRGNQETCIRLGIADKNSMVLPGSGVNLEYHTCQKYPENEGIVRFLFIGRLLKDKGIEEYFEMAKVIKEKYPKAEFRVLGPVEGEYQHILEELEKSGTVKYLGSTSDVRTYIGAVECTVLPSYHEGLSNVNLESSANGRPVITTDVPGCRETVDNGVTGFLVKAKDTSDLIDKVNSFINLPYEKKVEMGLAARKKVEREFDRQLVVDAYLSEIGKIAHV